MGWRLTKQALFIKAKVILYEKYSQATRYTALIYMHTVHLVFCIGNDETYSGSSTQPASIQVKVPIRLHPYCVWSRKCTLYSAFFHAADRWRPGDIEYCSHMWITRSWLYGLWCVGSEKPSINNHRFPMGTIRIKASGQRRCETPTHTLQ